ncbi:MAG TPA: hypothetical protein VIG99_27410 [Myxococcaceae bacterium]|jgi:hypothetical protein
MSVSCDLERMEALAFDELPLEQARRALEHAGACAACGMELSALRRERSQFHDRAAAQPALPRLELFAKVEGAARARERRLRVRREVAAFALCAASLLCVVGLSARSSSAVVPLTASVSADFEPCTSSECPRYSSAAGALTDADEIGRLDADFGACLVATPAHCR